MIRLGVERGTRILITDDPDEANEIAQQKGWYDGYEDGIYFFIRPAGTQRIGRPMCPRCQTVMVQSYAQLENDGWRTVWHCACPPNPELRERVEGRALLTWVRSGADWEALYLRGKIEYQGHRDEVTDHIINYLSRMAPAPLKEVWYNGALPVDGRRFPDRLDALDLPDEA